MNECLNCGKEVIQKEGRRKRLYCSDSCKTKFNQRKKGGKVRWISIEKHEELKKEFDELLSILKTPTKEKPAQRPSAVSGETVAVQLNKNSLAKHPLWQEGDPKEGSAAFFMRKGVFTYDELENKTKK